MYASEYHRISMKPKLNKTGSKIVYIYPYNIFEIKMPIK